MAGMLSQNLTLNVKCYVRVERQLGAAGTCPCPTSSSARPEDRGSYTLDGVGALAWRASRAGGDDRGRGRTWQAARRGFGVICRRHRRRGALVAEFERQRVRSGGTLRDGASEREIAPASTWKQRYALRDGERELALLGAKGWGERPVRVTVDDPAAVDPHVLLLAAFLTRRWPRRPAAAAST